MTKSSKEVMRYVLGIEQLVPRPLRPLRDPWGFLELPSAVHRAAGNFFCITMDALGRWWHFPSSAGQPGPLQDHERSPGPSWVCSLHPPDIPGTSGVKGWASGSGAGRQALHRVRGYLQTSHKLP